jgi:hypothetical protein
MILEHYPENEWGLGHAGHGRLSRARMLRAAGYVVDIETIRVVESPERPGAGPEFGSAPRGSRLGGPGSRSQPVLIGGKKDEDNLQRGGPRQAPGAGPCRGLARVLALSPYDL